jgi:F-type H+-transporting ATP synthase subunit e
LFVYDSGTQVVRYSALVGGIFYGIMHKRTLQAKENKRKEHEAEHRREKLIADARKAWQEQNAPKRFGGG